MVGEEGGTAWCQSAWSNRDKGCEGWANRELWGGRGDVVRAEHEPQDGNQWGWDGAQHGEAPGTLRLWAGICKRSFASSFVGRAARSVGQAVCARRQDEATTLPTERTLCFASHGTV